MSSTEELQLRYRQAKFVIEYCKDQNATQAAIRAGYSDKTAAEMGYENLNKPHIKDAVDRKLEQMINVAEIDALWVLEQRKKIITKSMKTGFNSDANTSLAAIEKMHLGIADKSEQAITTNITITNYADLKDLDEGS